MVLYFQSKNSQFFQVFSIFYKKFFLLYFFEAFLKNFSPSWLSLTSVCSGSCRSTYGMPERAPILPGNEAVAQCTREFSDISPLTGGNIAFSTLEGRPSSQNFEESEVLQVNEICYDFY